MDVKGAYLNEILKDTVFMHQPEGYKDDTEKVCLLIKTLYSLKQAGWEWNRELDGKLWKHGFKCLHSDPCAYVCTFVCEMIGEYEIITVWVDDLLLFASSIQLCEKMKKDLHLEWEITDLDKPAKIIGIEITRKKDAITMLQSQYVKTILMQEGMECANPIAMPLDLNIQLELVPDGSVCQDLAGSWYAQHECGAVGAKVQWFKGSVVQMRA